MSILVPGIVTAAASITLSHEAVPPEQLVAGSPSTGTVELGGFGDAEIGVWEMTVGAMSDVEVDEVFVVIAGRATVELEPGDDDGETIELFPGAVVRLAAGTRTVWTVTETLRKVYIS
ncbi:hypothetical protein EV379_2931 [Microterricola gilva]|uniref:(S)-ureidoglycine aminohydrolase cupin domain-containing protein n=1 Tax=Microterricola gilva TaxID=393267 RepID=A0A4Q8AR99_9MICO|nr:cupin domain-containing protein [Microterricola gilva]RZU66569.1 hypothetical protein EV379_2931 [Microterricola gilva]